MLWFVVATSFVAIVLTSDEQELYFHVTVRDKLALKCSILKAVLLRLLLAYGKGTLIE